MSDASAAVFAVVAVVVLGLGAVLGLVSRALLGRRSSLSPSASVLAGVVGAVLGALTAHVVTGLPRSPVLLPVVAAALVGTMGVLLVAERLVGRRPDSAEAILARGESDRVELKSTARHNRRTGRRDDQMELVVARTVAGFLNASGGTLLVGVDDDGRALGIADDLQHMKAPDVDRFELWLRDYLTRVLGAPAVTAVRVTFPVVAGHAICRMDVGRSPRPVFVRPPRTDRVLFVVRIGNATRELSVAEAIEYAVDHFHRRRWRGRR